MSTLGFSEHIVHNRLPLYGVLLNGPQPSWPHYKKNIERMMTGQESVLRKEQHGLSLLHIAVIISSLPAVTKLLEQGVDVDTRDAFGWTSLHHATLWDEKQIANCLLRNGASFQAETNNNVTCAMLRSWLHPKFARSDEHIPVVFEDDHGVRSQMAQSRFQELTDAQYVEDYVIARDVLLRETWTRLIPLDIGLDLEIKTIYRNRPFAREAVVIKKIDNIGLSLIALRPLARNTVLGQGILIKKTCHFFVKIKIIN